MAVPRSMAEGAVFSSMSPIRSAGPSLPGAVTLFVLLPAPAGTRVVPADLRLLALHGLDSVVAAGAGGFRPRRREGIRSLRLGLGDSGRRTSTGKSAGGAAAL